MSNHREVLVKVNAWVDEGIADLVSALSEIEGLITLESCQGDAGTRDAFVIFRYGDWQKCGELLFGRMLPRISPDLRAYVSLRLEAHDTDTALGRITLEPSAVPVFTRCVRELLAATVSAEMLATTASGRVSVAFDELRKAVA
jgi:hypothetical protein